MFWQSSYSVVWLVGVCTGINIHRKFEEWPKIVWIRHFVFCMFGLCLIKTLLPMQHSWKPLKTRWIHFNILRFFFGLFVFLLETISKYVNQTWLDTLIEYILNSSFFVTRKFNEVRVMQWQYFCLGQSELKNDCVKASSETQKMKMRNNFAP